jgi:hypothetical protein
VIAPALITPVDLRDEHAWEELLAIAPLLDEEVGEAWCLIGAQMVRVHAALAHVPPPRLSRDLDLLADSRVRPGATKAIAEVLGRRAFLPVGPSLLGTVHRFQRGDATEAIVFDILGPDNLGKRSQLTTYGNATTVAAPGGTFALGTATAVPLDLQRLTGDSGRGQIRLPSLAGALGIKACAVGVSNAPNAQLDDLIVLLSVVDDPHDMRAGPGGRKLAKMLGVVSGRIRERAGDDDRSLDARGVLTILTEPWLGANRDPRRDS